ncbi:HAD family hydrolase [Roseivivax marinus]|uniref:HAD family hydrolase n=1 Tax=Roseivivax marinus TaxID=1379903 RepID=UPI00351660FF
MDLNLPAPRGILFDKDGTLFGFDATWSAFGAAVVDDLGGSAPETRAAVAGALGFDLGAGRFHPDSPVVAGTADEVAHRLAPHCPGQTPAEVAAWLDVRAADIAPVPAAPLGPLLDRLTALGAVLGVVTNDATEAARVQLRAAGVIGRFAFIAGYDAGHGAKPAPGPLRAFAEASDLRPSEVAMVGDSLHDLHAARAAGMRAVAVLTGPVAADVLAPHADLVLPDVSHLPEALFGAARDH